MNLRTLLILGALCAFGPLAIDFYLPSFPTLAQQFATDVEHIQLSLAAYFVGIAIGQLFHGPLADRFGRRVPLLVGVALFAVGSLACAIAPSLEWLIAARFVQALGGCAGMVITRAVVRDLCDPLVSAKVFSQLVLVMGLAPILAPLGGGLLLNTLGWPWIFHSLAIFATLCLLAVLRWLPETRPQELPPAPLSGAFGQYRALLGNASFMGYSLAGGVAMAGMFAYIAGSPFVFIELYGVPAEHYGWLFGSNAAGFVIMAHEVEKAVNPEMNQMISKRLAIPHRLVAHRFERDGELSRRRTFNFGAGLVTGREREHVCRGRLAAKLTVQLRHPDIITQQRTNFQRRPATAFADDIRCPAKPCTDIINGFRRPAAAVDDHVQAAPAVGLPLLGCKGVRFRTVRLQGHLAHAGNFDCSVRVCRRGAPFAYLDRFLRDCPVACAPRPSLS